MPAFEDLPLTPTSYGRALYERGRELVRSHGARLDELLWDADEVLWDWLLSGVQLLGVLPRIALRGDLSHREWVLPRPGMLELLWGMRHESLALGLDPHIRIWTSGYPWRMWRIGREIPGFGELIGPPFDPGPAGAESMVDHPRVFTRTDYVRAMTRLLDPRARGELLSPFPATPRSVLARHIHARPQHSGLKIPELALLSGKPELARGRVLIDDHGSNVRWFADAGRAAIHVLSSAPRILLRAIPNSAWRPAQVIREIGVSSAEAIADALVALGPAAGHQARGVVVARGRPVRAEAPRPFTIDVPDAVLQGQWIRPIRAMVRDAKARFSGQREPNDREAEVEDLG
ncbi:MAG: hypothetical protein U1F43_00515 [Myxococcota bacterium]